jgi:anti-anti-sigma factor
MSQPLVVSGSLRSWHDDAVRRLSETLRGGDRVPALRLAPDLGERPLFEVVLRGEIDLADESVLDSLVERFRSGSYRSAAVNLRAVTFFNSTGLSFLASLGRIARRRGGELTLVGPSPVCLYVLKIVGLDEVFAIQS